MRPKRYLTLLLIGFLLFMGFSTGTTYMVDPYRIFFSPEFPGWNVKKPRAEGEVFFNRAVGIQASQPRTLLLGNSRILWGMRAGSARWVKDDLPVYNAGIPGSNLTTALAYLRHAIEIGGVKRVILGVDYFSSLVRETVDPDEPVILGSYQSVLKPDAGQFDLMREYALRIGSIDAFVDSFMTVAGQRNKFSPDLLPNGDNPLNEYRGYVADKGHYRLFSDYTSKIKIRMARADRAFLAANDSSPEFDALQEILKLSESEGLRIQLYFHPYHSTLDRSIREAGRYDEYQTWKQRVANIVAGHSNVELWDFGILNAWTSEPVPPKGDVTTHMQWYWEPGHYKSALGDLIIERLQAPADQRTDDEFARLLYKG